MSIEDNYIPVFPFRLKIKHSGLRHSPLALAYLIIRHQLIVIVYKTPFFKSMLKCMMVNA